MVMNKLLTKREILILLKYSMFQSLAKVAVTENLSSERVRQIISHALRKIREAARITNKSDTIHFESNSLIRNMAYDGNVNYDCFNNMLNEWIIQGLEDVIDSIYWGQISGNDITPENLMDFIHKMYFDKIHYYWKEKPK